MFMIMFMLLFSLTFRRVHDAVIATKPNVPVLEYRRKGMSVSSNIDITSPVDSPTINKEDSENAHNILKPCKATVTESDRKSKIPSNGVLAPAFEYGNSNDVKHAYCVWHCSRNTCCEDGLRTATSFRVIKNSLSEINFEHDVTLVTHGTIDRIQGFLLTINRWIGPKVVLFPIYNNSANENYTNTISDTEKHIIKLSENWENTKVIVFVINPRLPPDYYSAKMHGNPIALFPVNSIRNVLIDVAPTNWVFPLDMDFVPSMTLYSDLVSMHLPRLHSRTRPALVILHFEVDECRFMKNKTMTATIGSYIKDLRTFYDIQSGLWDGSVTPFHTTDSRILIPWLKRMPMTIVDRICSRAVQRMFS